MTLRKKLWLFVGIPVGLFAFAFLVAQTLAAGYESKLASYQKDQEGLYAVLAKSYQTENQALSAALQSVVADKKLPSFQDKVLAAGEVFGTHEAEVSRIATADAKYVQLLKKDVPSLVEIPGLRAINPAYDKALKKQAKVAKTIALLERGIAAEKFLATDHKAYFANMADVQTFISLETLTRLIEVFSAIIPGDQTAEDKKQKIDKYEEAVQVMIPGLTKVLKASPMPDHPYYADMRQKALDMLAKSKQMFTYYLDSLKNDDPTAKAMADALAQQDDGTLLRYRTIVTDSLLAPYGDAGLMERATKTLFSL